MSDLREKVFGFLNKLTSECDELLTSAQEICTWTEDEDGNWSTECGEMHIFEVGNPLDNSYKFCPYCGRYLIVIDDFSYEYEDDEDD